MPTEPDGHSVAIVLKIPPDWPLPVLVGEEVVVGLAVVDEVVVVVEILVGLAVVDEVVVVVIGLVVDDVVVVSCLEQPPISRESTVKITNEIKIRCFMCSSFQ